MNVIIHYIFSFSLSPMKCNKTCDDTISEIHCKISHSDLLLGSCENPANVIIHCIFNFSLSPMKCNKTCGDATSEIHCKISHSDLLLGSC